MSQPREARHQVIDLDAAARFGPGGPGVSPEIRLWRGDRLSKATSWKMAFDKAGVKKVVVSYLTGALTTSRSEGTPSGGDQGSRGSRPAAVALARAAARWAGPRPALAPPTHPPAPGAASPVAAVGNTICACP
jgi:hypothetical protein